MKDRSIIRMLIVFALIVALVSVLQAQDDEQEAETQAIDQFSIMTSHHDEIEFVSVPILSLEDAQEQGYIVDSECFPGQGYHVFKMSDAGPENPLLMFDADGNMIGLEFITLVEEQPGPLWVWHEDENVAFWTLHIFWTDNPESACEEASEG